MKNFKRLMKYAALTGSMEAFSYSIMALKEFFEVEYSLFAVVLYGALCGAMGGVGLWAGQKALNTVDKNFKVAISPMQGIFYGTIFLPVLWLAMKAVDAFGTENAGHLVTALRGGLAIAVVSAFAVFLYRKCLRFNFKLLPVHVSKHSHSGKWKDHHIVNVHPVVVFGLAVYESVFIYFEIILNERLAEIYQVYSLKVAAMICAGWFAAGIVGFLTAAFSVGMTKKIFGYTSLVEFSSDNVVPFKGRNEIKNDKAKAA